MELSDTVRIFFACLQYVEIPYYHVIKYEHLFGKAVNLNMMRCKPLLAKIYLVSQRGYWEAQLIGTSSNLC